MILHRVDGVPKLKKRHVIKKRASYPVIFLITHHLGSGQAATTLMQASAGLVGCMTCQYVTTHDFI
jgi:hypothetical protein